MPYKPTPRISLVNSLAMRIMLHFPSPSVPMCQDLMKHNFMNEVYTKEGVSYVWDHNALYEADPVTLEEVFRSLNRDREAEEDRVKGSHEEWPIDHIIEQLKHAF